MTTPPLWQQPDIIQHSQRLLRSFRYWTGRSLLAVEGSPGEIAQALFEAPFVVVSHGMQDDPIFNYGNRVALELWQTDWEEFTRTPSRAPVNPGEEQDREQLLAKARANGYVDNYQGIRISKTGRRFWIKNVLLWNVLDEQNVRCGQAATFDQWEVIETNSKWLNRCYEEMEKEETR